MVEIRIHGRGGQGAVVASSLLAAAFFNDGLYALAFPSFGVERRGAPVEAYVRFDRVKVLLRSNVYAPGHLIVLDPTVTGLVDVTRGLAPGGTILLNSPKPSDAFPAFAAFETRTVDAGGIALRHGLGHPSQPIVNTAILGAFAAATGLVTLDAVRQAIRQGVPARVDANVAAAAEAFDAIQGEAREASA